MKSKRKWTLPKGTIDRRLTLSILLKRPKYCLYYILTSFFFFFLWSLILYCFPLRKTFRSSPWMISVKSLPFWLSEKKHSLEVYSPDSSLYSSFNDFNLLLWLLSLLSFSISYSSFVICFVSLFTLYSLLF